MLKLLTYKINEKKKERTSKGKHLSLNGDIFLIKKI